MKSMQIHVHFPTAPELAVAARTVMAWRNMPRWGSRVWRGIVEAHRDCAVAYENAHQLWAIAGRLLAAAKRQEK